MTPQLLDVVVLDFETSRRTRFVAVTWVRSSNCVGPTLSRSSSSRPPGVPKPSSRWGRRTFGRSATTTSYPSGRAPLRPASRDTILRQLGVSQAEFNRLR